MLNDIFLKILEVSRAAVVIDIDAVRLVCEHIALGAHLHKELRRGYTRRAVGAVEGYLHIVEPVINGRAQVGYIIENRHLRSCDSADITADLDGRNDGLIEDYRLDLLLERVGELISVGLEYLYAVIFAGVVRGGNHYARIVLIFLNKERHCRGRHDAEEQNICADGAKTCADGGLKHLR